jgi:peptidoglycan/xylan/chitin deacetylase (PgdA/CDA1 family)
MNLRLVRILATLTVLLITACYSATVHASAASSGSATDAASGPSQASRTSVSSKHVPTTIELTFDDGPNRQSTPGIVSPPLTRAVAKNLTKTVYLTFDDGPNSTWTPRILSLLEEYGAHASFFVVGENAVRWPSLLQREADDGDTVGDHTWSHPNLTHMSQSGAYIELGRDRNWITTVTGTPPTLWRPPYEAFNASDVAIATGLQMKMQLWSVDTGDWQLPGTEVIVLRVMAALHNGMVVLLHDGGGVTRSETVDAVAILIPELEAAGYRLAALPRQGIGQ